MRKPPNHYKLSSEEMLQVLEVVKDDGHSIISLQAFPKPTWLWVRRFEKKHKSDGTPKGSITTDDGLVPSLVGIYTLDVLYALGAELKVTWQEAYGRGTTAQRITQAIREKLAPKVEEKEEVKS